MASKVYLKRGNLNYKERKYIKAIETALEQKGVSKSSISPATNFGELESLYNEHAVTNVEFEDIKQDKGRGGDTVGSLEEQHREFRKGVKETAEPHDDFAEEDKQIGNEQSAFVDPFNRAEPTVRDYVTDEGMKSGDGKAKAQKTTFGEPTTFGESFQLPNEDGEEEKGGDRRQSGGGAKKEAKKEVKSEPINPDFDKMPDSKKRKSTKKMAKAIIDGVCKLSEFGCVWYVTKDITEDKLAEYEIHDTMDLQILLTLEEGQQKTVRRWFGEQVKNAEKVLKVSDEEKSDLVDSLYEVMLEKGIAPTPMQELIINAVTTIVVGLGVKAYALGQQINNVIGQLVQLRKEQKTERSEHTESEEVREEPKTEEPKKEEPKPDENGFVEAEVVSSTELVKQS